MELLCYTVNKKTHLTKETDMSRKNKTNKKGRSEHEFREAVPAETNVAVLEHTEMVQEVAVEATDYLEEEVVVKEKKEGLLEQVAKRYEQSLENFVRKNDFAKGTAGQDSRAAFFFAIESLNRTGRGSFNVAEFFDTIKAHGGRDFYSVKTDVNIARQALDRISCDTNPAYKCEKYAKGWAQPQKFMKDSKIGIWRGNPIGEVYAVPGWVYARPTKEELERAASQLSRARRVTNNNHAATAVDAEHEEVAD